MIEASKLPCVRTDSDQSAQAAQDATGPDAAPAVPTAAGSAYPAKRLVLENGSYRVADPGE